MYNNDSDKSKVDLHMLIKMETNMRTAEMLFGNWSKSRLELISSEVSEQESCEWIIKVINTDYVSMGQ